MNATTESTVEAGFEVGESPALELHNVAGRVTVRVHDPRTIELRAVLRGSERAIAHTRVRHEQQGDRVMVRTERNDTGGILETISGDSLATVEYDLRVPRGCTLDIHTVSGAIDAEGTDAPAALRTVSGGIALRDAVGEITLESVSGGIEAERLAGRLIATSVSGGVTVRNSSLRPFTLNTVSGGMVVETPLAGGERYEVSTVSGSARVDLPADSGVTLQLNTVSGSLHCAPAAHRSGGPGHRVLSATVGDGASRLDMRSVSGSLTVTTDSIQQEESAWT